MATPISVEEERDKKENQVWCLLLQAYVGVQDQQDLQDHRDQEERGAQKENLVLAVLRESMENQVFPVNLVPRGLRDIRPTQDRTA